MGDPGLPSPPLRMAVALFGGRVTLPAGCSGGMGKRRPDTSGRSLPVAKVLRPSHTPRAGSTGYGSACPCHPPILLYASIERGRGRAVAVRGRSQYNERLIRVGRRVPQAVL
jgi:hypothetical protein